MGISTYFCLALCFTCASSREATEMLRAKDAGGRLTEPKDENDEGKAGVLSILHQRTRNLLELADGAANTADRNSHGTRRFSGTKNPSRNIMTRINHEFEFFQGRSEDQERKLNKNKKKKKKKKIIDVHFHIFGKDKGENGKWLNMNDAVEKQMTIMNEAFGGEQNSLYKDCTGDNMQPKPQTGTEFQFKLSGVSWTRDTDNAVDKLDRALLKLTKHDLRALNEIAGWPLTDEELDDLTVEEILEIFIIECQELSLDVLRIGLGKEWGEGDCEALTVFVINDEIFDAIGQSGTAGEASFPWDCKGSKERTYMDNIIMGAGSMPGGASLGTNEGDTLVHEVGHWLGLFHTFGADGNCVLGDEILDTPFQAEDASAACEGIFGPCCPAVDTCPEQPGDDPVSNFMDYSDDCCMSTFTRHQAKRMEFSWKQYRDA